MHSTHRLFPLKLFSVLQFRLTTLFASKENETANMRSKVNGSIRISRLKSEISAALWILGEKNRRVLGIASSIQILLSCSNILVLLLIGPLINSITEVAVIRVNLQSGFEVTLSRNQIFLAVTALITLTNLGSLIIRKLVLNSLSAREAEVTTAFIQASIFEQQDMSNSRNSSELTHIASESLRKIFNSIFAPFVTLVNEATTLFAVFLGLSIVDFRLTLIFAGYFVVFSALLSWYLSKKQKAMGREYQLLGTNALKNLNEINLLKKEISLAHKEAEVLNSFYGVKFRQARVQAESAFISTLPRSLLELLIIFGFGIFVLAHEIHQSGPIFASAALFIAASYRILPSLNSIIVIHGNLRNAAPVLDKLHSLGGVFSIRFKDPTFNIGQESSKVIKFKGDIFFENVFFAYPNSIHHVISNLSVEIPRDSTIWVQGASGSGKSTFLALVSGLMTPTRGKVVTIDNGKRIHVNRSLGGVCFLSQSSPLLDASFAYNIALRETTNDDLPSLRKAAESAGILMKILEAPSSFNENVGENGIRLSAGERQRLGLARCLFSNPDLLILDEPTANLDSESEALVFESLKRMKGSITIVIASHRSIPADVIDNVLDLGTDN